MYESDCGMRQGMRERFWHQILQQISNHEKKEWTYCCRVSSSCVIIAVSNSISWHDLKQIPFIRENDTPCIKQVSHTRVNSKKRVCHANFWKFTAWPRNIAVFWNQVHWVHSRKSSELWPSSPSELKQHSRFLELTRLQIWYRAGERTKGHKGGWHTNKVHQVHSPFFHVVSTAHICVSCPPLFFIQKQHSTPETHTAT